MRDAGGKTYLIVEHGGNHSREPSLVECVARDYVAFSGQNFPHILVPLLYDAGVMINVEKPLVIYESMAFDLQRLDLPTVTLRLADGEINVDGRRGDVRLTFEFLYDDEVVGTGCKRLLLSGLRPCEQEGMDQLVSAFLRRRDDYSRATEPAESSDGPH